MPMGNIQKQRKSNALIPAKRGDGILPRKAKGKDRKCRPTCQTCDRTVKNEGDYCPTCSEFWKDLKRQASQIRYRTRKGMSKRMKEILG